MNNAVSHQLQVPLSKLPTVPVNGVDPVGPIGLSNSSSLGVELDDIARLEGLLREIDDLSLLSPELLQRAIQAGCWYHVTPFRSNLVRALDIPPASRILEVGCGGGALTRFLGEAGYQVVALETDERLVECARLRCGDLSNVEVLEGFVEQVVGHEKFDFVVCVDPKLVESEFFDPGVQLLTMCRKVLKATGTLVLSVGNKLASSGGAHVECSRDHTRGSSVALESLRRSLGNAGFVHSEGFMTFPNHASPQLVVDCSHSDREQGAWASVLGDLYQHSEVSRDEMQKWWSGVSLEGIEMHLAPGWLILAHSHHVHSVLWGDTSAKFFPAVSDEEIDDGPVMNNAMVVAPTVVETGRLLKNILKAHSPAVNSVRDFKNSLLAADAKMEELANRESDALEKLHEVQRDFDESLTRHTEEIKTEQEARRIREAEMGLVLKQYHAVGAMCHDMREEGRKLKDMLEELRRRYSASEEWGNALLKRLSETEHELQVARSSLPFRMLEKVKRYFSKPVSARASLTPQDAIADTK